MRGTMQWWIARPDAILTLDTKSAIVLANPAAVEEFGYSLAELTELPASSLFDDQPAWHAAWNSLVRRWAA